MAVIQTYDMGAIPVSFNKDANILQIVTSVKVVFIECKTTPWPHKIYSCMLDGIN
jgi:hypothetical protein